MINSEELHDLLKSIQSAYGYDFMDYSESSLKRRVAQFMEKNRVFSVAALRSKLLTDDKFFEQFVQGITVNVTEMFRDPAFYKSLRENVIARLNTYSFIKIWVAGCATGEEVYSLAILLKEEGLLGRSVIYATDINQRVLQKAKDGIFPIDYMKTYTTNYIRAGGKNSFSDYYIAKHDMVMLDKALKQNIVFSVHNLVADKSFNEFQLILCRNVLIYFNQTLQRKVFALFYESLCPFGFLGLGNKESLMFSDRNNSFREVDAKEKIFMKTGGHA